MDGQNRKIRMATPENPREQGHTIVGGRPAGVRNLGASIPRGLEVIMMKAAVDEAFLNELLDQRSKLAEELGFPLDPAEKAILDQVPAGQLRQMARRTSVPEAQRSTLAGGSAAALIALVTQLTFAPVAARAEVPGGPQVAQAQAQPQALPGADVAGEADPGISITGGARPEDPGLNVEGGHRPDIPEGPLKAGGARPDDPWLKMPPGGARPDIPDVGHNQSKGIRPDIPPDVVSPMPSPSHDATPVATSPLTLDTLKNLVVRTDASGMTFDEALRALQNETGITMRVESSQSLDTKKTISAPTAGLTLGKVLRTLCGEAAGRGALYEIRIDDTSLTIRFKSAPGAGSAPSSPVAPASHVQPDGDSSSPDVGITRGIRPDIPRPRGE